MLAKQLSISKRSESVISYLFGPGRSNEHENQRIVGGSKLVVSHGVLDLPGDEEARLSLANELDGSWRQVRREQGLPVRAGFMDRGKGAAKAAHVFHATLSMAKDEGTLTDEQWNKAAEMFVKKMGFIDSNDGADCTWVAVHHGASKEGNDHVHIVVNLVREDGRRANIHQSKRRTARAGAEVAKAMGLRSVFEAERSSGIGNVSRAELERAEREERDADRRLIRRKLAVAAWHADSEADFVRRARGAGVLVRPRFVKGGRGAVEGYSAALAKAAKPVWFAPSKLDRSLGLPMLRERYKWTPAMQQDAVSAWRDSSARALGDGGHEIGVEDAKRVQVQLAYGEARHVRGALYDTSALLSAYALEVEGDARGAFARASDALAKAAQPNRGTASSAVRESVQTIFTLAAVSSRNPVAGSAAMVMQMMRLVESMQQRVAAHEELAKARAQFNEALEPLRSERAALAQQARAESFAALPEDAREALATAFPGERELREGRGARSGPSEPSEQSARKPPRWRGVGAPHEVENRPEIER